MGHFYFVRHGQTVWNVENKICGATDIALTEYGHEQAVLTGKKILEEGIQAEGDIGDFNSSIFMVAFLINWRITELSCRRLHNHQAEGCPI